MKASVDLEQLCEHFDSDNELFKQVVSTFIEIYPTQISELKEAKRLGDFKKFERTAHSIKGGVSNFYAFQAREKAFLLEQMGANAHFSNSVDNMIAELEEILHGLAKELKSIDLSIVAA